MCNNHLTYYTHVLTAKAKEVLDVEANNPKKRQAIALQYKPEDTAPKVVASGQGVIADRILDQAMESDVAIYKDEKLVKELLNIDIGANIPPELYEVVAQVLIFVSDLDKLEGYKKS